MKIDFHTHGKLAKDLYFSKEYTEHMFDKAKDIGLDAICLTEHFNTSQFDELYEYVCDKSERDGDSFIFTNGLRIFPGIEVDIQEGGHILFIGSIEEILNLRKLLIFHLEPEYFIKFEDLLDMVEQYDMLIGAAHPFRPGRTSGISNLGKKNLKKLDFIDLNGKDLATGGRDMGKQVFEFAAALNLPVIAGSDTHQEYQYGVVYNLFKQTYNKIKDLYAAVLEGECTTHISADIEDRVEAATRTKMLLKEIDALGGDYAEAALREEI